MNSGDRQMRNDWKEPDKAEAIEQRITYKEVWGVSQNDEWKSVSAAEMLCQFQLPLFLSHS